MVRTTVGSHERAHGLRRCHGTGERCSYEQYQIHRDTTRVTVTTNVLSVACRNSRETSTKKINHATPVLHGSGALMRPFGRFKIRL